MDASTILGLLLAAALIVIAIVMGGDPSIFMDWPSLLITFGGTIAVTFVKNPLHRVFSTVGVMKNAFFHRPPDTEYLITTIVDMSRKARRESLLALEKVEVQDPFLRLGLDLAVDGLEPASIRTVLETEIKFLTQRHKIGQELMAGISYSAPAFGMIGTLIGLVQMLAHMDDPARIGPSMATAILTTLYGALAAYVISGPIEEKLKNRSRDEVTARNIVLQGILAIVEGDHPVSVEQKLAAFVAPKERPESRPVAA